MRAHLILKPAGGDVGTEELPTAASIKSRLASAETVRKAEDAARQLGFTVVSTTPLQVTIEGAKVADGGALADLVPTCLNLLGIPPSAGMTGRELVTTV